MLRPTDFNCRLSGSLKKQVKNTHVLLYTPTQSADFHRKNRFYKVPKAPHAQKDEDEPDWEQEMSIFKQRIMRPNQLATLRELESKVNLGKVLYIKNNLAIISGLNPDAPLGTKLAFVSGAMGSLLWHRSDDLVFALVLGGGSLVQVGEGVECKIRGVLQVIDDVKGPITRKDFEPFPAPTSDALFGNVVDFLGRPPAWAAKTPGFEVLAMDRTRPLINAQVAMKNREQVSESLFTGVKALDILTPLGRGASMLVIGPAKSGKSTLALDTIIGQKKTGVKCVLALVNASEEEIQAQHERLRKSGALSHTTIIAVPKNATVAEKYATLCTAAAVGERVRDEGGHALVVIDDLRPLLDVWDSLVAGLLELGLDKLRAGLIKDESGRDISVAPASDEELVQYEGMLVSGAVAQRRGFFSTLFMRAAKLHSSFSGGSMSLLPVIPGRPATGKPANINLDKYTTLTEEQKEKMRVALDKKSRLEDLISREDAGDLKTEAVEEFISIADGQVVLLPRGTGEPYTVNPKLSITRIGSRAYYKALEALAPQVRLDLAQAEDARKFGSFANNPVTARADMYARRVAAALTQAPENPCSLADTVVTLLALQRGTAESVDPAGVAEFLKDALSWVHRHAPAAMEEIDSSHQLTAAAEKSVMDALSEFVKQRQAL